MNITDILKSRTWPGLAEELYYAIQHDYADLEDLHSFTTGVRSNSRPYNWYGRNPHDWPAWSSIIDAIDTLNPTDQ